MEPGTGPDGSPRSPASRADARLARLGRARAARRALADPRDRQRQPQDEAQDIEDQRVAVDLMRHREHESIGGEERDQAVGVARSAVSASAPRRSREPPEVHPERDSQDEHDREARNSELGDDLPQPAFRGRSDEPLAAPVILRALASRPRAEPEPAIAPDREPDGASAESTIP